MYERPIETTASAASTQSSGLNTCTMAVDTSTPTAVPAIRATPRLKVCAKSGRITMAEAIGAQ